MLSGCFDEGGDEVQQQSAIAVADGVIAFADIKNNILTDPAAAGAALLKFVQTPVAADTLISPPGELPDDVDAMARMVTPDHDNNDCLETSGSEGCDGFDTEGNTCEAGPFTFKGTASRTCDVCTDTMGRCTYDWDLRIGYVVPGLDLQIDTKGPITTTLMSIEFDNEFTYTKSPGPRDVMPGRVRVKSCGAAMLGAGSPKRLVSSSFVVQDLDLPIRCVKVNFDASGTLSATNPTLSRCTATGC
ncbi:MAG: hypothetical protein ACKV2T_09065 [Kofleriaceae bacterium]